MFRAKIFLTIAEIFSAIFCMILLLSRSKRIDIAVFALIVILITGGIRTFLSCLAVLHLKEEGKRLDAGDLTLRKILDYHTNGTWIEYILESKNNIKDKFNEQGLANQIKLSVLQSQINPHFLYNTLESIRGLAYMQGADRAAEMSEALGAYFRYSISNTDDIVQLDQEIENVYNYFKIQQFRFGDRASLEVNYSAENNEIAKYMLPKLTIQPIVENALFHGLENKRKGGCVSIDVYTTDDRLYIKISDNGIGMTDEDVANINQMLYQLQNDSYRSDRGMGIALLNINRRIEQLYGKEFGLSVSSTYGVGTEVAVRLPFQSDTNGVYVK